MTLPDETNGHSSGASPAPVPNFTGEPSPRTVVYLHGFLSSARSTKARFLQEHLGSVPGVTFRAIDFNPTPRDFETMTTTGQINRLRQYVLDEELGDVSLIGSSFGGLIALHYADRFGGVRRMLLMAPAAVWLAGGLSEQELRRWEQAGVASLYHPAFDREIPIRYDLHLDGLRYGEPVPPAAPTVIIHGRQDETVPIALSRGYADAFSDDVRLVEVDADHDLNGHLDLMWEYIRSFLLDTDGGGE